MSKYIPCDQIAKLNVAVKNLACAVQELKDAVNNPGAGGGGTGGSALNETVELTGVSYYEFIWDAAWIQKFGPAAVFDVYIQDQSTGKWLRNPVQAQVEPNPESPSKYIFNFGAPTNAVLVVS
jgi:hypothetical protein